MDTLRQALADSIARTHGLTVGQAVTTRQVGIDNTVTGTYAGPADTDGFVLVDWTTGTGRKVRGTFPADATRPVAPTAREERLTRSLLQGRDDARVIFANLSGYAVECDTRAAAYSVARTVLNAFVADPEAGHVQVRVVPGSSWRGVSGWVVRVDHDAR